MRHDDDEVVVRKTMRRNEKTKGKRIMRKKRR